MGIPPCLPLLGLLKLYPIIYQVSATHLKAEYQQISSVGFIDYMPIIAHSMVFTQC